MQLVDLLAQKTATERRSIYVNPAHIVAIVADQTAPTKRCLVTLASPVPEYGTQFVCTYDIKETRNRVNTALAG